MPFLDLGKTPLADGLVAPEHLDDPEARFPLEVAFCPSCTLVQILEEVPPELLFAEDYPYFSSFSTSTCSTTRRDARARADRQPRPRPTTASWSSWRATTATCCRNFVEAGVPCSASTRPPTRPTPPRRAGVPTLPEFFGLGRWPRLLREEHGPADVIIANNVMAHVPDLNGFVAGMAILVADDGVITVENPYVRDLIDHCEFDTIYHEHLCYFSCTAVDAAHASATGCTSTTSSTSPTCTAARCAGTSRRPSAPTADRAGAYLDGGARRPGSTRFAYYAELRASGSSSSRPTCSALLRGLRAEGKPRSPPTAPRPRARTLLNYVGHRHRPDRLRGRPQRPQAGPPHARRAPAHPRPVEALLDDAARLRADPRLELQGRDHAPAGRVPPTRAAASSSRSPTPEILVSDPASRVACPACGRRRDHSTFHRRRPASPPTAACCSTTATRPRASPAATSSSASATDVRVHLQRRASTGQAEYSPRYEETQGFSRRGSSTSPGTWPSAGSTDTTSHGKTVLEIGCGKGEFLVWMCEAGAGHGIGIDPGAHPERIAERRGRTARRGSTTSTPSATRTSRPTPSSAGTRSSTSRPVGELHAHRAAGHRRPPRHRRALRAARRAAGARGGGVLGRLLRALLLLQRSARWPACSAPPASRCSTSSLDYDDQYLLIEARPAATTPAAGEPLAARGRPCDRRRRGPQVPGRVRTTIQSWRTRLQRAASGTGPGRHLGRRVQGRVLPDGCGARRDRRTPSTSTRTSTGCSWPAPDSRSSRPTCSAPTHPIS